MFAQLPYPPAPPRPLPQGAPSPFSSAGRVCVVADSTAPAGAWRNWAAGAVLLDTCLGEGVDVAGFQRVRLRDHFAPQHSYTPLTALCVYHWLAVRPFDVVLFAGAFGAGYYSMVARDLGLAFAETILAVQADDSHAHGLERAGRFPDGRTDIELDFLERQTMARADLLWTGDVAFPAWCRDAGWTLPPQVTVGAAPDAVVAAPPPPPAETPFVSVCLTTYNRPVLLRQAVASLERQSCDRFEVVLVDDGSSDPAAIACLDALEPLFAGRGWTILRQRNAGVAAARNAAVQRARGSHILFMDDDNLALPHEVARFAQAAASGADIITCIPGTHPDSDIGPPPVARLPTPDPERPECGVDWTPVGASMALTALVNCLGDCNALYRRDMILTMGGYGGSARSSFEDFRFLLQAVLQGYRLEVLPEILFLYRRHRASRSMRDNLFHSHVDSLLPLAGQMPPALWPLLLSLRRDWYNRHLGWAVKD